MARRVPIGTYGVCGRLSGSSDRKVRSELSDSCRFRWSVRLETRPCLHRAWLLSAVAGGAPVDEARCFVDFPRLWPNFSLFEILYG